MFQACAKASACDRTPHMQTPVLYIKNDVPKYLAKYCDLDIFVAHYSNLTK